MGASGNVVLTRRPGRALYIGRGITLTVSAVRGSTVEFALEGPPGLVATPWQGEDSLATHLRRQAAMERDAALGRGGADPVALTAPLAPHQPLYVGRGIIVTVVSVQGQAVEVAVEAPQDTAVSRDDWPLEVHRQFQHAREHGVRLSKRKAFELAGYGEARRA